MKSDMVQIVLPMSPMQIADYSAKLRRRYAGEGVDVGSMSFDELVSLAISEAVMAQGIDDSEKPQSARPDNHPATIDRSETITQRAPHFIYSSKTLVIDYLRLGRVEEESDADIRISLCRAYASRAIEDYCGRWFHPERGERTYECRGTHISGRLLTVDTDLLTVSYINDPKTDAAPLHPNNYILRPVNWPPFFGVSLKQVSAIRWSDWNKPIVIRGTWGYGDSVPDMIVMATTRLAAHYFKAGWDDTPIPLDIKQLLAPYVKLRVIG